MPETNLYKALFIVALSLLLSSCGSAGDGTSGDDAVYSQDTYQSDPGEYPDCSGTYTFTEKDGVECEEPFNAAQQIVVTQDQDVLEYEIVGLGTTMSAAPLFLSRADMPLILGEFSDAAVSQLQNCWATIYVGHGMVVICHSGSTAERLSCERWYKKEPLGSIDSRDYPSIIYVDGTDL